MAKSNWGASGSPVPLARGQTGDLALTPDPSRPAPTGVAYSGTVCKLVRCRACKIRVPEEQARGHLVRCSKLDLGSLFS